MIGSRDLDRAREAAARIGLPNVEGRRNEEAAGEAALVILTVPLAAQVATLESVREALRPGTIVVDTTVALGSPPPEAGSAAQQAAACLPAGCLLVAGFHTVGAKLLQSEAPIDSDILLCGDSAEAKAAVAELVGLLPGARAVDAGGLANARLLENLAALLIGLNRRYKVKHSGVRITGLP